MVLVVPERIVLFLQRGSLDIGRRMGVQCSGEGMPSGRDTSSNMVAVTSFPKADTKSGIQLNTNNKIVYFLRELVLSITRIW